MKKKIVLFGLGAVMVWVGITIGMTDQTAYQGTKLATCGSAFSPNMGVAETVDEFNRLIGSSPTGFVTACRDKLGNQRILAWGLIGLGAAVCLGSLFLPSSAPSRAAKEN